MKTVTVTINTCLDCPNLCDTVFGNFCTQMLSVNKNRKNRKVGVDWSIPMWCPLPNRCEKRRTEF